MYIVIKGSDRSTTSMRRKSDKRQTVYSRKKGEKITDDRISVCIYCRYGIFKDHKYIWTSSGLVHTECENRRLNEAKNTT